MIDGAIEAVGPAVPWIAPLASVTIEEAGRAVVAARKERGSTREIGAAVGAIKGAGEEAGGRIK